MVKTSIHYSGVLSAIKYTETNRHIQRGRLYDSLANVINRNGCHKSALEFRRIAVPDMGKCERGELTFLHIFKRTPPLEERIFFVCDLFP